MGDHLPEAGLRATRTWYGTRPRWAQVLCIVMLLVGVRGVRNAYGGNKSKASTAGAWLQAAAEHESAGEHVQAGEAYEKAFEAFSPKRRKGVEGAKTMTRAAQAYWKAFAADLAVAHLESAIAALEQWVELLEPTDGPSAHRQELCAMLFQLQGIEHRLDRAEASMVEGSLEEASEEYLAAFAAIDEPPGGEAEGFDVIARPLYADGWSVGARIALHAVDGYTRAGEGAGTGDEERAWRLALDLLAYWELRRRPGDMSREASALQGELVRLRERLEPEEAPVVLATVPRLDRKPKQEYQPMPLPKWRGTGAFVAAGIAGGISWAAWVAYTVEVGRCSDRLKKEGLKENHCAYDGLYFYEDNNLISTSSVVIQASNVLAWGMAAVAGQLRGRHGGALHQYVHRRSRRSDSLIWIGTALLAISGGLTIVGLRSEWRDAFFESPVMFSIASQSNSMCLTTGIGLLRYGLAYQTEWRRRRLIDLRFAKNFE